MIATNSITAKDVEALKAEADALKAEADKLKAAYQKAKELVEGLTLEMASLPGRKSEAVINGDIEAYAEALKREQFLPAEITISEIAMARSKVNQLEAYSAWAKAYRTWASHESQRIGKNAGFPEGQAKGIRADGEYENARGIVHSANSPLGDAHRHLATLIEQASRIR